MVYFLMVNGLIVQLVNASDDVYGKWMAGMAGMLLNKAYEK